MRLLTRPLTFAGTPQDVLRALRDDRAPFLLVGDWAGGRAVAGAEPLDAPPEPLAAAAGRPPSADAGDGRVGGGWFGWLGYGLGAAIETLPPAPPRPHPLPVLSARFYDHVLRQDADGCWFFEALETPERAAALAARYDELVRRLAAPHAARPWRLHGMAPRAPGYAGHRWAVAEAVRRIAAGDLFQANVCLRLDGRLDGDPLDAFAAASATLAPARGAYVTDGARHLLSFSPELFLRRAGDRVWTAPIKGTAPRGGEAERVALAASAKDAAEHVMIVDLMRNDLGRVAAYGSVVAHPPQIEAHPGVWHLVSTVEARLRADATDADLIRACFPPGSVTGAPKVHAMGVIAALEGTQREAYTGAIGYLSPVAGLELNVAIRTLEVSGGHAWLGAGGGVVADSDPDGELQEALAKARPVLAALGATVPPATAARPPVALPHFGRRPDPRAGFNEALLAMDGEIPALDAHLARLGDDRPRADLLAAARAAGPGRHRLRLVLRPGAARHAAAPGPADLWTITVLPAGSPPAPVTLDPVLLPGGLGAAKWADRAALDRWTRPRLGLIVDSDGSVLEATSANVFLREGDRYVTPPADGRILPGVTRAAVVELVGATEEQVDLARLDAADAVVLTSAIALVTPVGERSVATADALRAAVSARWASAPPTRGPAPSPAGDRSTCW